VSIANITPPSRFPERIARKRYKAGLTGDILRTTLEAETMATTLYYAPMSRAGRARWMLEELAIPYQLHRLDVEAKEHKQAAYLALNPTGHIPTLVDGDQVVYKSLAIVLYLGDRYGVPKGLAPAADDKERGKYLTWTTYAIATLEKELALYDRHTRRLPEGERVASVAAAAKRSFLEAIAPLEQALPGKTTLLARFSGADVLTVSVLEWAKEIGVLAGRSALDAYVGHNVQRAAAQRARAD
jgi:glutathione S-transferase